MRTLLITASYLLTLGLSAPGFAASAEDAAYDKNNSPVIDSRGNCVRTMWQDQNDPCAAPAPAPAPAPKPVPVVRAPAPAPAPVIAREARTIYFDFNKSNLTDEAITKLDDLAQIINNSASITDVTIHGFTDQIGSDSYNNALANQRVAAAKAYLDGKSRLPAQGDIRGLGKANPEEGCTKLNRKAKITCMAKERRVEIEFNAQK